MLGTSEAYIQEHFEVPDAGSARRVAVSQQASNKQTEDLLAIRDTRDKIAFSHLFDFYGPRIKSMLMRSNMSDAQAEDILQDVMLTIWNKAHLFDAARASASAWIFRIAKNRMIDITRKDKRVIPSELYETIAEPATQSTDLERLQEAKLLRQALGRIPDDQRRMIERAYLGELTHQEIQKATGIPIGTIKSRIRLGLEKLRRELKNLRNI